MKKIIVGIVIALFLIFGVFLSINQSKTLNKDQLVLAQVKSISRDYLALRYQTDNILINAKNYSSYDDWRGEITQLIIDWEDLADNALLLENNAAAMTVEKISLSLISPASAYDNQEISNVFDRAPAGKKIVSLAKYLGVDAKMAYQILKNDQAQVEADAWNEAGDTFQKLETSAVLIKDTAKIAGFVGTIAMTGGTAAVASSGALGQAAVIISGADLALEISDDSAKIAFGNNNKISAITSDLRTVTEPLSSLLMITTLPNNLVKGIEKLNVVSFGLEQFNSVVQEGKVIGLKIPAYTKGVVPSAQVAVLEKNEVEQWLVDQGIDTSTTSVQDLENVLGLDEIVEIKREEVLKQENVKDLEMDTIDLNVTDGEIAGKWQGVLTYTPSQSSSEEKLDYEVNLNADGSVSNEADGEEFSIWKKNGDLVRLFLKPDNEEDIDAFFEFRLSGRTLTFIKLSDLSSAENGEGTFAGESFFGGKFYQIVLTKS